jgi:hypothetical protein
MNWQNWFYLLRHSKYLRWKFLILGCLIGQHCVISLGEKRYCIYCEKEEVNEKVKEIR